MAWELRLLRSLVVLGEEQNVGRAAARLTLTQPGLSKQIAQLERMAGLALFDRHPKGVTPTAAGAMLIERARDVLAEADAFDVAVEQARRGVRGRLNLGFVGQAVNEHTAVILREFRERHPDVTVDLRQYDMHDLTAGLGSGTSDLAFLRLPVSAENLRHEPVLIEPRVAVLPDDHPLAPLGSVRLSQLLDEPWVVSASPDPAYQRFALATSARRGRPPVAGPVVRNIDEYLEAVLAHQGIGLAPESAARYYARPGITYVRVPDAEPSVASASRSTRNPPQPAARAMLHLVRSRLPFADPEESPAGRTA